MEHLFRLHVLASGSKGNASIVEGPEASILIDCGISYRELVHRATTQNVDLRRIAALLLTHEHTDHTKGIKTWCKHFNGTLLSTSATVKACDLISKLPFIAINHSSRFTLAGMQIQTFPISHDVADPIGFRISIVDKNNLERDAIGFCTDTGYLSSEALKALRGCRILGIEANHDVSLLDTGPYPIYLKERIKSNTGHLSNTQTAQALPLLISAETEDIVALHLSEKNNTSDLCLKELGAAIGAKKSKANMAKVPNGKLAIYIASQTIPLSL
jgi:phosphoribosyl 1,2-cyclic phosphodiesterase